MVLAVGIVVVVVLLLLVGVGGRMACWGKEKNGMICWCGVVIRMSY